MNETMNETINKTINDTEEHTVLCLSSSGFHRMRYYGWGAPDRSRTVICVHGLTRNGRDFDPLARSLSAAYRVLCPDVAGRGRSDWLDNHADYNYPQYLNDMTALIARSGAAQIDWVGTSMGGLIGLMLAAQPRSPIRRLVVNDVGPFIPAAALRRIAGYVGEPVAFEDIDQLERYLRVIAAPFGPLGDAQWRHLAVHSARELDDGRLGLAYDPGIAEAFKGHLDDIDLWPIWERVRCPVLVLRGADSDLLRREDALAMTRRGPGAELVEFDGVGHAPALMDEGQIVAVRDWLAAA